MLLLILIQWNLNYPFFLLLNLEEKWFWHFLFLLETGGGSLLKAECSSWTSYIYMWTMGRMVLVYAFVTLCILHIYNKYLCMPLSIPLGSSHFLPPLWRNPPPQSLCGRLLALVWTLSPATGTATGTTIEFVWLLLSLQICVSLRSLKVVRVILAREMCL